jgi:hypothetical protein
MFATEVSMSQPADYIKSLPKPTLYSMVFTVLSIAGSIAIAFLLIKPLRERSVTMHKDVADLQAKLTLMKTDLKTADQEAEKTADLTAQRDQIVNTGMLKPDPISHSLRMGAKSLMMPLATKAGFKLEGTKDLPPVLIRLPASVPNQIYARQPVEFVGRGSFDAIMQFVQLSEETHPLTILSGLAIVTQPQSAEIHKAVITFEWPMKYEWSK